MNQEHPLLPVFNIDGDIKLTSFNADYCLDRKNRNNNYLENRYGVCDIECRIETGDDVSFHKLKSIARNGDQPLTMRYLGFLFSLNLISLGWNGSFPEFTAIARLADLTEV